MDGHPLSDNVQQAGIYIDDFLIGFLKPLETLAVADPRDEDVILSRAVSEVYDNTKGVPEAVEKQRDQETKFLAWGPQADGVKGQAGAPPP